MSRHATRFNKRDAIEPAILQALARLAVTVLEGPPLDLWCWLGSRWVPIELKSGKTGRFTEGQEAFIEECRHFGRPCLVWRSPEDAVQSVQEWRQRA